MNDDPGFIDTPPIHEKAALYLKANDLLDSDLTEVIPAVEHTDGTITHALLLVKETDKNGDLHRNGYDVVSVKRTEAYSWRGASFPENTEVKAYWNRELGHGTMSAYNLFVDDGYPEITPYEEKKGLVIPDDLSPPRAVTKMEALDLRSILMGLAKEL